MLVLPTGAGFPAGVPETNVTAGGTTGTTLTANASANTKATSWTSLLDPTTGPSYGIYIRVIDVAVATTLTGVLLDIAYGPTGGGNEQLIIPDLNCGGAPDHTTHIGGKDFFFPIYIPAGVRVSGRIAAATGSDTCVVQIFLYKSALYTPVCSRVSAYGVDAANSRGTAVTPGNNAFGTWTVLKAGPMDRPHKLWFAQLDQNTDTSQFDDRYYLVQLGVGPDSSNVSPIFQAYMSEEGGECMDIIPPFPQYGPTIADAAADLWCRMAETGAAEVRGVIAYGMD